MGFMGTALPPNVLKVLSPEEFVEDTPGTAGGHREDLASNNPWKGVSSDREQLGTPSSKDFEI